MWTGVGLVLVLCAVYIQVLSPFMGSVMIPSIDPTLPEDLGHLTFVICPSLICCRVSDTLRGRIPVSTLTWAQSKQAAMNFGYLI